MRNQKLESVVVDIPGQVRMDPLKQAQEISDLTMEVISELKRATAKCQSINQIGGYSVSVVGLKITGRDSVENIGITYISGGKTFTRDYPKEDFYDL